MASYAKLLFIHTIWIFTCPQFSALEDIPPSATCLEPSPYKQVDFSEAQKWIIHSL